MRRVKVKGRDILCQVLACTLDGNVREASLYKKRNGRWRKLGVESEVGPAHAVRGVNRRRPFPCAECDRLLGKLAAVKQGIADLSRSPTPATVCRRTVNLTLDGSRQNAPNSLPRMMKPALLLANTPPQVDLYPTQCIFRIGDAQDSRTRCSRQFRPDAVPVKFDGVVAGRSTLSLAPERRACLLAVEVPLARRRHQLEVAEFAVPANSAHMHETEALDRLVTARIARAVVATRNRVRRKLHETEWRRSPWECLAAAVNAIAFRRVRYRPDKRIDMQWQGNVSSFRHRDETRNGHENCSACRSHLCRAAFILSEIGVSNISISHVATGSVSASTSPVKDAELCVAACTEAAGGAFAAATTRDAVVAGEGVVFNNV